MINTYSQIVQLKQFNQHLASPLHCGFEVARHADKVLFNCVARGARVLLGDAALLAHYLEGFIPLRFHLVNEGDAELFLVVGEMRDRAAEDGVAVLVTLFQLQKHQFPKKMLFYVKCRFTQKVKEWEKRTSYLLLYS